ncbi:epidermal growth factor-like protein 6 isoform X3 [Theropithecus gelada]|uniref:epidermal growth factor-like protein 6 isoform X3 n=1 Tax=Theropithecus gelada TaxID=9565 RepID=UPI000DC1A963|nr:epidermal growth factor-like protein 6 isoform X3 [Theropithecus gelada]
MPLPWSLALPLLLPWVAGGFGNAASARHHGLLASARQPGVCHYGTRLACCYGWRRNSKGVCEATCEPGCKFGECMGPNKCRCFPGYTGKTCSQDVNECGMKPRPCQHRCVNTHGSYKCFCLSGHMLMPDATCVNSRTCAMTNCQYGCEDTEEGPQCLCPSSGLLLAPNGRVCLDIDECASGKAICPYNRRCVNTFGSYYCKCHIGFELQYISGQYECMDKKGNEEKMKEGLEEEKREEKALKNDIEERSLRGDVFFPKVNEAGEFGLVLVQRKALTSKLEYKADLNISVDCSFDHGICDWKQDREDDFDWNPADRDNAIGYYMAVPALAGHKKDIGRLKLLLPDLQPQSNFCLLFGYRLAGDKVGKLRVFVKNSNNALAWEETTSEDEKWKTGKIQLYQGTDATKSIVFEAERGKGKTGEIAVDGVLLVSGLCPDSLLSVDD